ncbi:MAG: RNA recognition motif domain-containing protein [Bacteroidota bacterium]
MRIYAGNLSLEVTEEDLRKVFLVYGQVSYVKINREDVADDPLIFGMVGMPLHLEAKAAISALNRKKLKGKSIEVKEAGVFYR